MVGTRRFRQSPAAGGRWRRSRRLLNFIFSSKTFLRYNKKLSSRAESLRIILTYIIYILILNLIKETHTLFLLLIARINRHCYRQVGNG